MNIFKLTVAALGLSVVMGMSGAVVQVFAQTPAEQIQKGVDEIGGKDAGTNGSLLPLVQNGINVFLFIIGAIAVVMIIYGGFKYVTSRGEAADVSSAKNTILYAVVGLIVAILAYAVVEFVVDQFAPNSATEAGRAAGEAARDAASQAVDDVRSGR